MPQRVLISTWAVAIFLITYQVALLIGLPFFFIYYSVSWPLWIVAVGLMFATGIAITGGYHRLYSHHAYKTNKIIEAVFLFFGAMALQGSAYSWVHDHRHHHAHGDHHGDPYSVRRDGFWHAHMGWLLKKQLPFDKTVVKDLERNSLVMNQHKYYFLWGFGSNVLICLLFGWLFNAYLASFVILWWLRVFVVHHGTWCINSLAHVWGRRTFGKEQTGVDNYLIALITFGEGYHNFHHTFQRDYRNGIRWFHYDPTKWLIWFLSKCKLAYGLVRTPSKRIEAKRTDKTPLHTH